MVQSEVISGFVLAGGKSRRMGTDKALIQLEEESLLQRMLNLLKPYCDQVFISSGKKVYNEFQQIQIQDIYAGCGPISGLHACLKHSVNNWNLVVGVDIPFVNDEILRLLISARGEYDCIIPRHGSKIEPLIGLYHRNSVDVLEEMIHQGDYKLMDALSKLNVCYLDCTALLDQYPKLFLNLNTPDDLTMV